MQSKNYTKEDYLKCFFNSLENMLAERSKKKPNNFEHYYNACHEMNNVHVNTLHPYFSKIMNKNISLLLEGRVTIEEVKDAFESVWEEVESYNKAEAEFRAIIGEIADRLEYKKPINIYVEQPNDTSLICDIMVKAIHADDFTLLDYNNGEFLIFPNDDKTIHIELRYWVDVTIISKPR